MRQRGHSFNARTRREIVKKKKKKKKKKRDRRLLLIVPLEASVMSGVVAFEVLEAELAVVARRHKNSNFPNDCGYLAPKPVSENHSK
jgi:hypothetical protein